MRTICILPLERESKDSPSIRTVYVPDSTILMQEIEGDHSMFETAISLVTSVFDVAGETSDSMHYVGSMTHEGVSYECIILDLTSLSFKTDLKKVQFRNILHSDRKHNDALLVALCFKAVSYLK